MLAKLYQSSFLRFSTVGGIGFISDVAVFYVFKMMVSIYFARLISFFAAVTVTWLLNRRLTFSPVHRKWPLEWLAYLSVNAMGGLINLALFFALMGFMHWPPLTGLAVGAVGGLIFNYMGSRFYVYGQNKDARIQMD